MVEANINSILAIDCGSAMTTVALIEPVSGIHRLVATGQAPSTYNPPWQDITIGMLEAIRDIEKATDRTLFNLGGWPIIPQKANRQGLDAIVIVSSAGPPLPVMLAGLMKNITLASAHRAVAATYVVVTNELSLDMESQPTTISSQAQLSAPPHNGRPSAETHLQAIQEGQPEAIVLVGGTDGGATQPIIEIARLISTAIHILKNVEKPTVLYAGNIEAREQVAEILEPMTPFKAVDNIRPSLGVENLAAVQTELENLYTQRRMSLLPGFQKLDSWSQHPIIPASKSFEKLISYLGQYNNLNVIGVNIGSGATMVSIQAQGYQSSVVRSDAGVGYGLASLLKVVPVEKFFRWLPFEMPPETLHNHLLNKSLYPTSIPETEEDILIEQAVAREALRLTVAKIQANPSSIGVNNPPWNLLLGAGRTLTRTPQPGYAVLTLLDGLEPWGVTNLALDFAGLTNMLGSIALLQPIAAVSVATHDAFMNLGAVIAPWGHGQPGKTALKLKIDYPGRDNNGSQQDLEVAYGSLHVIDLPAGEKAILEIHPARQLDIGLGQPGRGVLVEVEGGLLGLIIDARGRPLRLPTDDARRQAQIRQWLEDLRVGSRDATT